MKRLKLITKGGLVLLAASAEELGVKFFINSSYCKRQLAGQTGGQRFWIKLPGGDGMPLNPSKLPHFESWKQLRQWLPDTTESQLMTVFVWAGDLNLHRNRVDR